MLWKRTFCQTEGTGWGFTSFPVSLSVMCISSLFLIQMLFGAMETYCLHQVRLIYATFQDMMTQKKIYTLKFNQRDNIKLYESDFSTYFPYFVVGTGLRMQKEQKSVYCLIMNCLCGVVQEKQDTARGPQMASWLGMHWADEFTMLFKRSWISLIFRQKLGSG